MNSPLAVPDWYGRLNTNSYQPTTSQTPASGLWMIIHDDWFDQEKRVGDPMLFEEVLSFRRHAQEKFPDALIFDFLPLIFVRGSLSDVQSLSQIPRFRYVLPQSVDVEDYLPILRGINALRSETGHQIYEWYEFVANGGTLPHEKFVSGMMPAREYPPPLDAQLIVADRSIPRATSPAWMPVINLSLGPMLADSPANPVMFALIAAVNTHLVVIAAGNSGECPNSLGVNSWAPTGAGLVVGASDDEAGTKLAEYSSKGKPGDNRNHPDVIAWGVSALGTEQGTSFATPRVSKLGCVAAAAIFQVTRVLEEINGRPAGVPLMGWGLIDTGSEIGLLPARNGAPVLPFGGVHEQVLCDAFHHASMASQEFHVFLNGSLLRSMLLKSARPMHGYSYHEVGAGFVSEEIFLEWLAHQSVGEFLEPFGPVNKIPASFRSMPLFERDALADLANAVRESQPTWFFDYERQRFGVNQSPSENVLWLPASGRGYPHAIHVAAS